MLRIDQIADIKESLESAFAKVTVYGNSTHARIEARDHNRMPTKQACKHPRIVRARDVTVCMHDGYLVSGDNPLPVASVDFCQQCEKVLNVVKPEELRKPRVIKKAA